MTNISWDTNIWLKSYLLLINIFVYAQIQYQTFDQILKEIIFLILKSYRSMTNSYTLFNQLNYHIIYHIDILWNGMVNHSLDKVAMTN